MYHNKVKAYKVKGSNLKQGRLVDNTRLAMKEGFARTKEETNPEITHLRTGDTPLPLMSWESNRDEMLGLY